MSNLTKRIITSIFLIFLLYIAFKSIYILFILLLLIFYESFYEFSFLLKKIYFYNKVIQYLSTFLILIFLFILNLTVWLIFLLDISNYKELFFLILAACVSSDIGGYVLGKVFKGKKLTRISPNKTYSGLFGSYLFSLLTVIVVFQNIYELNFLIFLTLIISTISQIGDLIISYLKRKAKFKDTGNLLPGHGGLLDRIDGLIFALPIGLLLFITL